MVVIIICGSFFLRPPTEPSFFSARGAFGPESYIAGSMAVLAVEMLPECLLRPEVARQPAQLDLYLRDLPERVR